MALQPPKIEIVVEDAVGACIAAQAGADSIELCVDLDHGGVTPQDALIDQTLRAVKAINPTVEVHILVLPQANGFYPDAADLAVLEHSIAKAVAMGADGVVFGALTAQDQLDIPALVSLIAAAGTAQKTFHRAFDRIATPDVALEQLIDLGFTRLLTSGGAGKAIDNIPALQKVVNQAGARLKIVAGGGIRAENLKDILAIRPSFVHMSCREAAANDRSLKPTNPALVRHIVQLCRA